MHNGLSWIQLSLLCKSAKPDRARLVNLGIYRVYLYLFPSYFLLLYLFFPFFLSIDGSSETNICWINQRMKGVFLFMNWSDLFIIPTDRSSPTGAWAGQVADRINSQLPPFPSFGSGSGSSSSISYPTSAGALTQRRAAAIDYLNADMAKHYKMGKASAYQEALANTSYQRAVADMKAAGLNPAVIFGAGRGTGASSSVYASSGRSGGSSGRGYYNQQSDKAFSTSEYSLLSAIGGLIGIALTGRPDGYWVGSQTTQGAMSLIDIINNGRGKSK